MSVDIDDALTSAACLLQYVIRRHGKPEARRVGPGEWEQEPKVGELVGCHVSFDPDEVHPDTAIKVWRDGDERLHIEMQWPHVEGDGA